MKNAILWFRNDLRLLHNPTLINSLSKAEKIIPVYIFDTRQWRNNQLGIAKTGNFRTQFVIQSVLALREKLKDRGSNLLIKTGFPELIIPALVQKFGANHVFAASEPGVEEHGVLTRLEKNLWEHKAELHTYHANYLIHPDQLPFPLHALPDVFTKFRKDVERGLNVLPELPEPTHVPTLEIEDWGHVPALHELNPSLEEPGGQLRFMGGEAAAWQRINAYFWENDLLKTYKETRNGLIGDDYSSKLSPYLSVGAISPVSIYHQVKQYERTRIANESTYWLIFELLWRDYFRYINLKFKSALFKNEGITGKQKIGRKDLRKLWRWANGETGIPFIDANMKELKQTGFMSNRGRQNVACYLAKVMGVDWVLGAEYFESMLLDYDVSSNWGNWLYVAGVGNDPRENRFFNPHRQAQMYDPKGIYQKHYLPDLAHWSADEILSANELQRLSV
jgi:deoxyribodipyrimidine photo-lyase